MKRLLTIANLRRQGIHVDSIVGGNRVFAAGVDMRTKSSFWAALRRDKSTPAEVPVLEQIRSAMLAALAKHCGSMQPQMEMELALAISIEALWQKRPRLLQAIASYAGPAVAARELQTITDLFVGHHPDAAR